MNFCNSLALKVVLEQISEGLGNKNVVKSPLLLNAVLNMVAVGSKGRTLEQFLEALEARSIEELNLKFSEIMDLALPDDDNNGGGPLLSIVNGVWSDLRCPLKPSFEEVVKEYYKADARTVDFVNKRWWWYNYRSGQRRWRCDFWHGQRRPSSVQSWWCPKLQSTEMWKKMMECIDSMVYGGSRLKIGYCSGSVWCWG